MMSKTYTAQELEDIMKENKIWPYEIATLEQYNDLAQKAEKLKYATDIVSALWFANITDSIYEFEFKNSELFDFDKEYGEDAFYLGQKVVFNYQIKNEKEKN